MTLCVRSVKKSTSFTKSLKRLAGSTASGNSLLKKDNFSKIISSSSSGMVEFFSKVAFRKKLSSLSLYAPDWIKLRER